MKLIPVTKNSNFKINYIIVRFFSRQKSFEDMTIYDLDHLMHFLKVVELEPLTCTCEFYGRVSPDFSSFNYYLLELTEEEKTILALNNNFLTKLIT